MKIKHNILLCMKSLAVEEDKIVENVMDINIAHYLALKAVSSEVPASIPLRSRNIDSFSASDRRLFFGILQPDLKRLCNALNFPRSVTFDNRINMLGETVFCGGFMN